MTNSSDLPPLTQLAGRRILFVMAAAAEYGPELRKRITPLMTGVGPIEAALASAAALTKLHLTNPLPDANTLPDLVVSLGSAGSAKLTHCGLYQATSVSWRDMDASALGFPKGETPFLDEPATLPLPLHIPGIAPASLSTGANIVSGTAYDAIPEDMVDMETYAIARACCQHDVPLIALRGISDGKSDLTGVHDWTEYLHIIDEKLGHAIDRLESALASNQL